MKASTIRPFLISVVLIWVVTLFGPSSITVRAQDDLPLPIQVLQTVLGVLVPADTPVFHLDALTFLDADLSKDETVTGMAFHFSEAELPGVWMANYKAVSEHPTGTGDMGNPLFQSCENRAQIVIINTQRAPSDTLQTPDEDFANLSISEIVSNGFATPTIVGGFEDAGLEASNYLGTQSFYGLDLHFLRVPLFEEELNRDTLQRETMIKGYRTWLIWQDGEWIFLIKDFAEMAEYYQLFVDGEDMGTRTHYQDTCPISRHPSIDAFHWAEILYQTSADAGLMGGVIPTPLPAASVSCSLRPEIGKPLVLEADFSDGQGGFLKNQPVWIFGEGEFGRLINLDNPLTSGTDWVEPGSSGMLVETNSYGRLVLPAAVAISGANFPISPLSPLTGGLSFTIPGPQGTSIPVGHCEFSIDYIAMSDSYYGAVGLDPAMDPELPSYCLNEVGLSGKALPPKFRTFTSGDVLLLGSCGIPGSLGFADGNIVLEYIDNTAVSIQYRQPDWITGFDHPPYGEYVIGHSTQGLKISADHNSLFTFGLNKTVERLASKAAEFSLKLVFKRGLGPVTGIIAEIAGNYAADEIAPLTYKEENILALRVLQLRSLVEISYEQPGGEIRMRTFEGNPEILVPETNTSIALTAGQETRPFDANPAVVDFEVTSAETWWDLPEGQAANLESRSVLETALGQDLEDARLLIFLSLMCLCVLFSGMILVGLMVILRRRKKLSAAPAVSQGNAANPQGSARTRFPWVTCLVIAVLMLLLMGCCGVGIFFGRAWLGAFLGTEMSEISAEILPPEVLESLVMTPTIAQPEALATELQPTVETKASSAPESLPEAGPTAEPTQETIPESQQEPPLAAANALTSQGPWIVFAAEDGLWAINPDGSGLTHLVDETVVAPTNLGSGISPDGGTLAFVTASDAFTLQDLTLQMLKLPEGTVETITRLTSPETEPDSEFEPCDPKHEAARAVTIGDGLGWSRDGRQLAFIGAMLGTTADLYVYSLDDGGITRLTNGPSQAYGVYWSPSDQYIVHFGASCFGTGAGFNMMGAWAAYADNSDVIELYTPSSESWGEIFIMNEWGGQDAFFAASASGCPLRDLRRIAIETQQVTDIHPGCFVDYAPGPTNLIAVLTNQDFSDDPGLYIYEEAGGPIAPRYIPGQDGFEVEIHNDLALILETDFSQPFSEVRAVNIMDGEMGWYMGQGEIPVFSPDETHYAWLEGSTFYLAERETGQRRVLSDQGAYYPFWFEQVGPAMGDVRQRLLYFAGESLYLVSAPDYQPVTIAEGLNPQGMPVKMRASQ